MRGKEKNEIKGDEGKVGNKEEWIDGWKEGSETVFHLSVA